MLQYSLRSLELIVLVGACTLKIFDLKKKMYWLNNILYDTEGEHSSRDSCHILSQVTKKKKDILKSSGTCDKFTFPSSVFLSLPGTNLPELGELSIVARYLGIASRLTMLGKGIL